jgi:hypothetical protein
MIVVISGGVGDSSLRIMLTSRTTSLMSTSPFWFTSAELFSSVPSLRILGLQEFEG